MEKSHAKRTSFKMSICNEDSITGAVANTLLQSSAAQTSEAFKLFLSELMVNGIGDFTGHSQNKLAKMQENVQKEIPPFL